MPLRREQGSAKFRNLRVFLLVGVCGGVPDVGTDHEMLLGDVVVSTSVLEYDKESEHPHGFEIGPNVEYRLQGSLKRAVGMLATHRARTQLEKQAAAVLEDLQARVCHDPELKNRYKYPGAAQDRLFEPGYHHRHHLASHYLCATCLQSPQHSCKSSRAAPCDEIGCSDTRTIWRERLEGKREKERLGRSRSLQAPFVHVGSVASSNKVMRSPKIRDEIARQHRIVAFEMEGAGMWRELPCIIVKGVSDYADSHKNKHWQHFAAGTAACVAKALLVHCLAPRLRADHSHTRRRVPALEYVTPALSPRYDVLDAIIPAISYLNVSQEEMLSREDVPGGRLKAAAKIVGSTTTIESHAPGKTCYDANGNAVFAEIESPGEGKCYILFYSFRFPLLNCGSALKDVLMRNDRRVNDASSPRVVVTVALRVCRHHTGPSKTTWPLSAAMSLPV
ncbi:hypothetical protein PCL_00008 [Purpureocillium lilacinum]|uniref:Uncharacterized protein n=1 Tax=Purpureocillium lilacinum TaxID=33203 RepID=A0A2U3DPA1_PURLI|nr:hypothetical protein PCL_00008 [Purpureocillium lilacinum]